ncbi:hypothetical protein LZ554_009591 [Drepanopeziza brunnea f. sp. 'monogermtubi']|nr:hypothetical protein LZ554_009591 [Drepanopeziza brunnea f. sp. 'monogermtubi']
MSPKKLLTSKSLGNQMGKSNAAPISQTIFGRPIKTVTHRTIFRWTRTQNQIFRTFAIDPAILNVSIHHLDLTPLLLNLGVDPNDQRRNSAGTLILDIITPKLKSKLRRLRSLKFEELEKEEREGRMRALAVAGMNYLGNMMEQTGNESRDRESLKGDDQTSEMPNYEIPFAAADAGAHLDIAAAPNSGLEIDQTLKMPNHQIQRAAADTGAHLDIAAAPNSGLEIDQTLKMPNHQIQRAAADTGAHLDTTAAPNSVLELDQTLEVPNFQIQSAAADTSAHLDNTAAPSSVFDSDTSTEARLFKALTAELLDQESNPAFVDANVHNVSFPRAPDAAELLDQGSNSSLFNAGAHNVPFTSAPDAAELLDQGSNSSLFNAGAHNVPFTSAPDAAELLDQEWTSPFVHSGSADDGSLDSASDAPDWGWDINVDDMFPILDFA